MSHVCLLAMCLVTTACGGASAGAGAEAREAEPPSRASACSTIEHAEVAGGTAYLEGTTDVLELGPDRGHQQTLGADPIELRDIDRTLFVRAPSEAAARLEFDLMDDAVPYSQTGHNHGVAQRRLDLAGGGTLVLDLNISISISECP